MGKHNMYKGNAYKKYWVIELSKYTLWSYTWLDFTSYYKYENNK